MLRLALDRPERSWRDRPASVRPRPTAPPAPGAHGRLERGSCLRPRVEAEVDRVFLGARSRLRDRSRARARAQTRSTASSVNAKNPRASAIFMSGCCRPPPLAGDDRRVLAAPLLHAEVDDRQVRRAEDAERRGELPLALAVAREGAEHQVRDVDEDAEERGRQARIPRPVVAPGLRAPRAARSSGRSPRRRRRPRRRRERSASLASLGRAR